MVQLKIVTILFEHDVDGIPPSDLALISDLKTPFRECTMTDYGARATDESTHWPMLMIIAAVLDFSHV